MGCRRRDDGVGPTMARQSRQAGRSSAVSRAGERRGGSTPPRAAISPIDRYEYETIIPAHPLMARHAPPSPLRQHGFTARLQGHPLRPTRRGTVPYDLRHRGLHYSQKSRVTCPAPALAMPCNVVLDVPDSPRMVRCTLNVAAPFAREVNDVELTPCPLTVIEAPAFISSKSVFTGLI